MKISLKDGMFEPIRVGFLGEAPEAQLDFRKGDRGGEEMMEDEKY